MSINKHIKIERKPEVLARTGFSRSTLHLRIKENLFVPPVSLGDRAVGWIEHEVNAVLSAMIAGSTKDELRALVSSLVEQRKGGEPCSLVPSF